MLQISSCQNASVSCILVLCTCVHRYFSASTHVYINQSDADLTFVQQRKKVGYLRRQEISIEDIARAAGVSHSTVSRALRDNPLISADVRERIQQLAHEMGYTPNAIAQSLQRRRTSTIGLVVTSMADPFWGDVMKGVEEVARAAGFSVILSASHNDPDQEMTIIETLHRRRVDGVLVAASRITSNYRERLNRIRAPPAPITSQPDSNRTLLHSFSL